MAFRDTWHSALVYFGLAEEHHEDVYEDDDTPEVELEDRYRERPNVRRLSSRPSRDDFDDIFADDEASGGGPTAVLRPVNGGRGNGARRCAGASRRPQVLQRRPAGGGQVQRRIPVVLNLQGIDTDLSKRLIDFASGLTYALDGGMQRIADKVFMLTPRNVEISAEERASLIEKGFFNQS